MDVWIPCWRQHTLNFRPTEGVHGVERAVRANELLLLLWLSDSLEGCADVFTATEATWETPFTPALQDASRLIGAALFFAWVAPRTTSPRLRPSHSCTPAHLGSCNWKSSERFSSEKEGVFLRWMEMTKAFMEEKGKKAVKEICRSYVKQHRFPLLNRESRPSDSAIGQSVATQHWWPLKHLNGRESMNESEESLTKLQHTHI